MDISTEKLRLDDIIIAVMGPTGTGKSNFIEALTQQPGTRSSRGLGSHTIQVQSTLLENYEDARNLVLVDTPGFDGAHYTDVEVLDMIGGWLKKTYRRRIRLTGILYLHRITDNRMGGTSLRSLRMFGGLCGDAAMGRVMLVTTMWDKVRDIGVCESREKELRETFWRVMLDKGSTVARFDNSFDSAKEIVHGLIAEERKRETLLLQEELVDLQLRLNETYAGRILYHNLQQVLREQKASMEKLVAQIDREVDGNNPLLLERLRREQKKVEEDLEKTLDGVRKLKVSLSRRIVLAFFWRRRKTLISHRQNRLRCLVSELVETVHHRAKIAGLAGDEAQIIADYLNDVLHETNILENREGKRLLDLLCELAKSAKVYPRCYVLRKWIQRDPGPIGGGGFADVYKGKHGNQTICLKVTRIFQKQDRADFLRAHMKEMVVWAHLSHPNILPFYGVYLDGSDSSQRICLVSPWMRNGNLREYLDNRPSIHRIPLVSDVINGLRYLHQSNIIHGDLKAQNVLLSDDGRALITDFGVSYIALSTPSKPVPVTFPGGTTRWKAPELLSGGDDPARPTRMCDIWSFGCLCYEILTRKIPFYQYAHDHQVIYVLQSRQEVPVRPSAEDASDEVDNCMWDLMVDCWDYEPQKRPTCTSIQEFILGLKVQDNRPGPSSRAEDSFGFWRAMKAKSNIRIDYERIEKILLRVGLETA